MLWLCNCTVGVLAQPATVCTKLKFGTWMYIMYKAQDQREKCRPKSGSFTVFLHSTHTLQYSK
jgi:hypothetical protein